MPKDTRGPSSSCLPTISSWKDWLTANGNFRILPDGSIEAKNGKFGGEVNAETGYIGGFAISGNHIGVSSRVLQPDGSYKVVDDRDGLFLYDTMIGFNAKRPTGDFRNVA